MERKTWASGCLEVWRFAKEQKGQTATRAGQRRRRLKMENAGQEEVNELWKELAVEMEGEVTNTWWIQGEEKCFSLEEEGDPSG